jgi:hypothetical protein
MTGQARHGSGFSLRQASGLLLAAVAVTAAVGCGGDAPKARIHSSSATLTTASKDTSEWPPSGQGPGKPASPEPTTLYWGAQIGDQFTGEAAPWDMRAVSLFEQAAGKKVSLVGFGAPFEDCTGASCVQISFPSTPLEDIRAHGAIPVFSWSSSATPGGAEQPDYQLRDVIDGKYDAYITEFARAAKAWGHPFLLRFNWEMNGFWFPWSEQANGNEPGEYVEAWRHVHDIFTSVGANNASWVWCPNVEIGRQLQSLQSLYPGDGYVDWTCLDGFNWGVRRGSPGWLTFPQIFGATYDRIVGFAPDKPMILAETASSDSGGDKAAWIRQTFRQLPIEYPHIRGIVWFDVNDRGTHWPIENSGDVTTVFRSAIGDSSYIPGRFANLNTSPIPPPPGP